MPDVEVLYHGKGRQTGVTDLRDGRNQSIWFSVWYKYRRQFQTGRESDEGGGTAEFHKYIAIRDYWCTTNELGESWTVNINLIENGYT